MNNKMGRRDFLGTAALAGAVAAAGRGSLVEPAAAATEAGDGITSASAGELAEAIRSKQLSSKAVVEAHLEQIAKVNPKLNAIVQLTADAARKEADEADAALARGEIKGPLHGVPVTIKDTLETTGVICTGGTKGRANFVPKADATAVARLRAAGGIILGKTNVPELAGALESDNLVYGRTNNPYDLARTPGGSSGGEVRDRRGLRFAARPRHRCRRQHSHARAFLRPRGDQADLRPRAAHRTVSDAARRAQSGVSRQPDRAKGRGPRAGVADHCRSRLPRHTIVGNAAARSEGRELERIEAGVFRRRRRGDADQGNQRRGPRLRKGVHGCGRQGRREAAAGRRQGRDRISDMSRGDGGVGTRAFLKSIGSDQISPLFEKALTAVAPAMANTTEALAAFVRWDLFRNSMLRFMENYDAVLSPVAPFRRCCTAPASSEQAARRSVIRRCTI